MKHVLFLDMSATGLRTVDRALQRGYRVSLIEPDAPTWYADTPSNMDSLAAVHRHVRVPTDEMEAAAAALHAEHRVDAVLWLFERSSRIGARIADRLGARAPARHAVERTADKHRARRMLTEAGLSRIRFAQIEDLGQAEEALAGVGFPAIVKPNMGAGSTLCARLDRMQDWERFRDGLDDACRAWQRLGESYLASARAAFLIEEYVTGPMVSVELAACAGRTVPLMVSGRRRCIDDELVDYRIDMPADLSEAASTACSEYAIDCVRALGLDDGVFHVEIIVGADGPVCVEVNPRLMGGYMPLLFNQVSPLDIHDVVLDVHVEGIMPTLPPQQGPSIHAATIRIEAREAGGFDPAAFAEVLAVHRHVLRLVEPTKIAGAASQVCRGDVLARVQVVASTGAQREARVAELLEDIERRTGVRIVQ